MLELEWDAMGRSSSSTKEKKLASLYSLTLNSEFLKERMGVLKTAHD